MRLFWKKRRSPRPEGSDETSKNRPSEQPATAVDDAGNDMDDDQLRAAQEARQMIHVSETTVWRYKSGLW